MRLPWLDHYSYNAYIGDDGGKAMSVIQSVSVTPVVTDCLGGAGSSQNAIAYYFYPALGGTPANVRSYGVMQTGGAFSIRVANMPSPDRHLETAYYLFADGHVKALKPAGGVNNSWGGTNGTLVPPYNGYDYNGDGVAGTTNYQ